jgi:uncharacterized protein with HEPN domain
MPSKLPPSHRWLNDIRHHINLAIRFAAGHDYEAFHADLHTVYAVIRCLEIISEASRRLPAEVKARHPSIAWKRWPGQGASIATPRHMGSGVVFLEVSGLFGWL